MGQKKTRKTRRVDNRGASLKISVGRASAPAGRNIRGNPISRSGFHLECGGNDAALDGML